jgi:hypothetical protein
MASVVDFGAVGDGRADDTEAIRHAVAAGAGRLVFPRGVYRLTGTIDVRLDRDGPIALDGDGGAARVVMAGPGPALRLVGTLDGNADPKNIPPAVWESQRLPTVANLEIEGAHDAAEGVVLDGTMQATLTGLLIRRCRVGVHLVRRNRNVLLANLHIYDGRGAAIGVHFDGVNLHQTIVVGCHISYCRHAGIKVERSEIRNLQITGCDIEYNFDPDAPDCADVWIDARAGTVREGTIASCTIQAKRSPGGANVRIEGPPLEGSTGAGLWTIAGNILQSQDRNLWLKSCRGVAVSGNSFASAYERSLVIEDCRHVAVGTNTFDHNPDYGGDRIDGIHISGSAGINLSGLILESAGAGTPEAGGAIEVERSSDVTIQGCQVLDPVHRGIDLRDVTRTLVSGCTVVDRRADRTMREAIRLRGAGANLIAGNLVGPGTAGAVVLAEGSGQARDNLDVGP